MNVLDKNLLLLLIVVLVCNQVASVKNIDFSSPDISLTIEDDSYLEAFKSKLNDEIINNKDKSKYSHLTWYSIGHPTVVSDLTKTRSGILFEIGFLSNEFRIKIKEEIKKLYDIDVDLSQIKNLPLNSFKCDVPVKDEDDSDYLDTIHGTAKNLNKYPLEILFDADINLKSRYLLLNTIENEHMVQFSCIIESGEDDSPFERTIELSYSEKENSLLRRPSIFKQYDKSLERIKQSVEKLDEKYAGLEITIEKLNENIQSIGNKQNSDEINRLRNEIDDKLRKLLEKSKHKNNEKLEQQLQDLKNTVENLQDQRIQIKNSLNKVVETIQENKVKGQEKNITLEDIVEKTKIVEYLEKEMEKSKTELLPDREKILKLYEKLGSLLDTMHLNIDKFSTISRKFGGNFEADFGKHSGSVLDIKIINSTIIATSSSDKTVKIWSYPERSLIKTLEGHSSDIWALLVIDNRYLVSAANNIRIRAIQDGFSHYKDLDHHSKTVTSLALLSDDKMASGDLTGNIYVFLIGKQFKIDMRLNAHNGYRINSLAVLSNGNLASASADGYIKIWDSNLDLKLRLKSITNYIYQVNQLVVLGDSLISVESGASCVQITFWKFKKNNYYEYTYYTPPGSPSFTSVAAFNENDVVVGSSDGSIYRLKSKATFETLNGHKYKVNALAIHPDGSLISGSNDGTIKIWS